MSYAVLPSCGRLHLIGAPFYGGPIFVKGFPNHPSLWPGLLLVMIQSATLSE